LVFLFADNMADFADELLRIAVELKGPKRGEEGDEKQDERCA
ncbi:hypothetical protein A2U01_0086500, partial [Trifolium medium]|nr:hypothetical protein [Trifolium medium]